MDYVRYLKYGFGSFISLTIFLFLGCVYAGAGIIPSYIIGWWFNQKDSDSYKYFLLFLGSVVFYQISILLKMFAQ